LSPEGGEVQFGAHGHAFYVFLVSAEVVFSGAGDLVVVEDGYGGAFLATVGEGDSLFGAFGELGIEGIFDGGGGGIFSRNRLEGTGLFILFVRSRRTALFCSASTVCRRIGSFVMVDLLALCVN
jgi:hypothetical protein